MKTALFILERKLGLKTRLHNKNLLNAKKNIIDKNIRLALRKEKIEIESLKKRIKYLNVNFN